MLIRRVLLAIRSPLRESRIERLTGLKVTIQQAAEILRGLAVEVEVRREREASCARLRHHFASTFLARKTLSRK